nr:MAG TPA: hypothetical protein [Caudoviricetes sp.]
MFSSCFSFFLTHFPLYIIFYFLNTIPFINIK